MFPLRCTVETIQLLLNANAINKIARSPARTGGQSSRLGARFSGSIPLFFPLQLQLAFCRGGYGTGARSIPSFSFRICCCLSKHNNAEQLLWALFPTSSQVRALIRITTSIASAIALVPITMASCTISFQESFIFVLYCYCCFIYFCYC